MTPLTPETLLEVLNKDHISDLDLHGLIDDIMAKYPASPIIKILMAKSQLSTAGKIESSLRQQLLLEWRPDYQFLDWENYGGSFTKKVDENVQEEWVFQQVTFEAHTVANHDDPYPPEGLFTFFIWNEAIIVPTLEVIKSNEILAEINVKDNPKKAELAAKHKSTFPFFIFDQVVINKTVSEPKPEVDGSYLNDLSQPVFFVCDLSDLDIIPTIISDSTNTDVILENKVVDQANFSNTYKESLMESHEKQDKSEQLENSHLDGLDFMSWLRKLPGAEDHIDTIGDLQRKKEKKHKKSKSEKKEKIKVKGIKKGKHDKKGKKKKKKDKKNELEVIIQSSVERKGDLVSETLAMLLANQGHTDEAVEMYEKLILINPEKSSFFAARIRELKKNI